MVAPHEAVSVYIEALKHVQADLLKYTFRVQDGRICLGHKYGEEPDEVQWAMLWHTPEEFLKLAKMRRLDLTMGDPRVRSWRN